MALLVQYGADIDSVEASTHLHQSPPYRWIKRLRKWDSHAEGRNSAGAPPKPAPYAPFNDFHLLPFAEQLEDNTSEDNTPEFLRRSRWRQRDLRMDFMFAPLALAARIGHTKAAKWLLENGANPEVPARDLCRCDQHPMISYNMWRVPHQAIGTDLGKPHWTPLHLAIHYDHNGMVRLLVAHNADTRQVCRSTDGPCSALHTAFSHRRRSIIEFLMHRFQGTDMVDINARGRGGMTPLHIAYMLYVRSMNRYPQFVDMALGFGAYINFEYEVDQNQWTLFAMACAERDSIFAMRLLNLGANAFFDLEQHSGGRWATSDFRRSIGSGDNPATDALARNLDQFIRDHEVAQL